MNGSTNIETAVRIRPYISCEKQENIKPLWQVKENAIVQIADETVIGESYTFDHIYEETKTNQDVYSDVVQPLVMSCLQGINSTIFAYGQTSSGKTHTMLGDKDTPGIISLAIDDVFRHVDEKSTGTFVLRCSYLEIYNEKINDLLHSNATDLKIREDVNQGVHVIVKEEIIQTPDDLFTLMKKGMKTRKVGSTDMNERSSRSHSIFKLVIQSQSEGPEGSYRESTLSLVDLAGSERVGQMKMGKDRQVEGVSINKSLTALGLVIRKLSEGESFVNYRDSKLTRILQDSLGGNSKTLIIATITVAASDETRSTLDFAHRAKFVKNRPVINRRVTNKYQLKEYDNCQCQDYKDQIEKITGDKDKIIKHLEQEIQCLQRFHNVEQKENIQRVPPRRYPLAHLQPEKKTNEFSLPSNNEEVFIDGDHFFQDVGSPKTTITTLKREKELLEESYQNLVLFTNLENQLKLECSEDRRLMLSNVKDVSRQLHILQRVLGGGAQRYSSNIYTIAEESMENPENSDDEEKGALSNETLRLESVLTEMNHLKDELKLKNVNIDKLNTLIIQERDTREAELDILNSKIKELTSYKEEMHVKLSEYQRAQTVSNPTDKQPENVTLLKQDNQKLCETITALKQQLESAFLDLEDQRRLYDTILNDTSQKTVLVETLEAKIRDLQSQLEDCDVQRQCLEFKHCQIADLKSQLLSEQQQNTDIQKLRDENAYIKSELDDLAFELAGERKELETVSEELETKCHKIKDLELAVSTLMNVREEQAQKITELTTANVTDCAKNDKLMGENANLTEQCHSLTQCLAEHIAITSTVFGSYLKQDFSRDNKDVTELIDTLKEQRQSLKEIFAAVSSSNSDLKECASRREEELQELRETSGKQAQKIAELTAANATDCAKNNRELHKLLEENANLTAQCHSLTRCLVEHIKITSNLFGSHLRQDFSKNDERQDLAELIDSLTEQRQSLKEIFAALSSSNSDLKECVSRKEKELQTLRKTSGEIRQQCESLERQISERNQQIEELRSCNVDLQKIVTTKSEQLHSLGLHVDKIASDLSNLRNTNENIKAELEKKAVELQEASRTSSAKDRKINELENRVEQAEQRKVAETSQSNLNPYSGPVESGDLSTEREPLSYRIVELEKQVVHLESLLRKRMQLYTKLSRDFEILQEESAENARKCEQQQQKYFQPVLPSKKLVKPAAQEITTIADIFGKPIKVCVQDNASQTSDNGQLEAMACDKYRKKLDQLTAVLTDSKFEFKSRTLEDQIQELLLFSVKRANQEPAKTCSMLEERKSRVSDEMKKVKERRHSSLDQRRGLTDDVDGSFGLDEFGCETCDSLRNQLAEFRSQITALTCEVDTLKSENKFLDKEAADMLQMIQEYKQSEMELYEKLEKYEQCQKVDKETQATCDLQQKYNTLKRLVKYRNRQENNSES